MNLALRVPLNASPEQAMKLLQLQAMFALACNALAPVVQKTRVWNRVALHHMAYKALREQFPQMGSQMVCNAIYSVSRHSRLLFQSPASPFHLSKLGEKPLPLLRFADTCPVYFDRHTLSLKAGQLSMYTLDGRMRFQLSLGPEDEANFHEKKLREIVLSRTVAGGFELQFSFSDGADEAPLPDALAAELPEYVMVEEAGEAAHHVIPAQAGIQGNPEALDPRLRGDDGRAPLLN
jgi:hypothetical protein